MTCIKTKTEDFYNEYSEQMPEAICCDGFSSQSSVEEIKKYCGSAYFVGHVGPVLCNCSPYYYTTHWVKIDDSIIQATRCLGEEVPDPGCYCSVTNYGCTVLLQPNNICVSSSDECQGPIPCEYNCSENILEPKQGWPDPDNNNSICCCGPFGTPCHRTACCFMVLQSIGGLISSAGNNVKTLQRPIGHNVSYTGGGSVGKITIINSEDGGCCVGDLENTWRASALTSLGGGRSFISLEPEDFPLLSNVNFIRVRRMYDPPHVHFGTFYDSGTSEDKIGKICFRLKTKNACGPDLFKIFRKNKLQKNSFDPVFVIDFSCPLLSFKANISGKYMDRSRLFTAGQEIFAKAYSPLRTVSPIEYRSSPYYNTENSLIPITSNGEKMHHLYFNPRFYCSDSNDEFPLYSPKTMETKNNDILYSVSFAGSVVFSEHNERIFMSISSDAGVSSYFPTSSCGDNFFETIDITDDLGLIYKEFEKTNGDTVLRMKLMET